MDAEENINLFVYRHYCQDIGAIILHTFRGWSYQPINPSVFPQWILGKRLAMTAPRKPRMSRDRGHPSTLIENSRVMQPDITCNSTYTAHSRCTVQPSDCEHDAITRTVPYVSVGSCRQRPCHDLLVRLKGKA